MTDIRTEQDTAASIADDDGTINPDRAEAPALTEVQQLAQEMGWDPSYQPMDGKPARSAQNWIKSANSQNRNLRKEVADLKSSVERIASVADKQVRREVQAQAMEIEQRFQDAVEAKDKKGAVKAAQDMRDLEAEQAPAPTTDHVTRFQAENAWYGTDPEATDYAVSVSNRLAREGVTEPSAQIDKVREAVLKRFPEHASNAGKAAPRRLELDEPGTRATVRPRAKTFADMPEVARAAADRFYKAAESRGTAGDRKAYDAKFAADYYAEQG